MSCWALVALVFGCLFAALAIWGIGSWLGDWFAYRRFLKR